MMQTSAIHDAMPQSASASCPAVRMTSFSSIGVPFPSLPSEFVIVEFSLRCFLYAPLPKVRCISAKEIEQFHTNTLISEGLPEQREVLLDPSLVLLRRHRDLPQRMEEPETGCRRLFHVIAAPSPSGSSLRHSDDLGGDWCVLATAQPPIRVEYHQPMTGPAPTQQPVPNPQEHGDSLGWWERRTNSGERRSPLPCAQQQPRAAPPP